MTALPVTVDVEGDSTTLGAELFPNGTWGQSLSNVPKVLQSKYAANVKVNNHGVSGVTMPQTLQGFWPAVKTWAQKMSESPAHIVTINLGINDSAQTWETDALVRYYLQQLIYGAQQHGKTVLLETPNPITTSGYQRVAEIAQIIRTVGSEMQLRVADHHSWIQSGLPNWQSYLPDGIHPNAALYEFKANNLHVMIDPLIQWYLTH